MAQPEVGPNDIVIHLVNPYKCGDCGSEFCSRPLFLDHLGEHLEKMKLNSPCHQIICGTSLVEQQPNGITVTRDILQINENQMFELQDPTIDYTQLSALKALEQAGILHLPPPQLTPRPPPLKAAASKDHPLIINFGQEGLRTEGKKISLLGNHFFQRQTVSPPQSHFLKSALEEHIDSTAPIGLQEVQETDSSMPELDAIVQRALFEDGKIKGEYSITIENPGQGVVDSSLLEGVASDQVEEDFARSVIGRRDPVVVSTKGGKKSVTCPICLHEFANASVLQRHQVIHTRARPYTCAMCYKAFNDISSLRKHVLIHKRQHRCPVCHRMYLRRSQLDLHMRHHDKRRFIQFGSIYHEVRVSVSRNSEGQIVQEYSLLLLLDQEKDKTNQSISTNQYPVTVDGGANEAVVSTDTGVNHTQAVAGSEEEGADDNVNDKLETESQRAGDEKKKTIYRCGHCKEVIYTRPTLTRHLIKHTNTRPFKCETCPKSFRDKADLFHHRKTHTKPVKCKTCNTAFSKVHYLQNHLLKGCPFTDKDSRFTVLPDLRCQCNVCLKILKNKANMLRHLKVHAFQERTPTDKIVAEDPNPELMSQNVEDHFQALHNSVGFQCLICGQEFRFKSFMITHIRMHLNQRPFKCQECPKSFFARHMLKKHQQNHSRPYKCPVCNKGFIRRYLMKAHFKKRHEEEDPLKDITELLDEKLIQCDICGKTMKSCHKSLMLYHIRLHKDVRPYECSVCHKSFISDNALKKHSLNHSKPYVCPVCSKGFSRRYLLTEHFKKKCIKKKGSLSAAVQKKLSESLVSEQETEAEEVGGEEEEQSAGDFPSESQPYQASVTQMVDTTGATIYTCQPCDKKFVVQEALLRHLKTFARATACKYCKAVFSDKHLTVAHQRSCLGVSVTSPQGISMKRKKVMGNQQEKVQKMVKEINEKIGTLTSTSESSSHQEMKLVFATPSSATSTNETAATTDLAENSQQISPAINTALTRTLVILKESKGKFSCPQCDRSFNTPRGLKIHASSHVRLYKCEVCDKDFTQIASLRAHARVHTSTSKEGEDTKPEENIAQLKENVTMDDNDIGEEEEDRKGFCRDNDDSKVVQASPVTPVRSTTRAKRSGKAAVSLVSKHRPQDEDTDDEEIVVSKMEHKDLEEVSQRLMQSGTRGRPFSCKMCRRRFTENCGLQTHMQHIHGVKS